MSGPHDPIVPVGGGVPVDPETGERYGYLPKGATGRKLVIRAPLGMTWVLGALAAALVLAVAGVAFWLSRPDRPGAPFRDAGPLSRYAEGEVTALADGTGWVDRRDGLRAYLGDAVSYCPADGGWVDVEGRRYDREGRAAGGGEGLARLPVRAAAGRLYVDPDHPRAVVGDAGALGPCPAPQAIGDAPPADGL